MRRRTGASERASEPQESLTLWRTPASGSHEEGRGPQLRPRQAVATAAAVKAADTHVPIRKRYPTSCCRRRLGDTVAGPVITDTRSPQTRHALQQRQQDDEREDAPLFDRHDSLPAFDADSLLVLFPGRDGVPLHCRRPAGPPLSGAAMASRIDESAWMFFIR